MLLFFYYVVKVILCSAVLFIYYRLFLLNKVFHGYNRFYLLSTVPISLITPLLNFNIFHNTHTQTTGTAVIRMLKVVNESDEYVQTAAAVPSTSSVGPIFISGIIYSVIALCFLLMMIRMFMHIYMLARKHKVIKLDQVYMVITDAAKGTPFSFFDYIFWNDQISIQSEAGKNIFKHELAHVRQKHSADKLFINLVLIPFWINPVYWLIRKELNMIHEFMADRLAVEDGDTDAFAKMILATAYPGQNFLITNHFFSPIKRRIMMLQKNQSPRFSYISRLAVLPVLAALFCLLAFKVQSTAVLKPIHIVTKSFELPTEETLIANDVNTTNSVGPKPAKIKLQTSSPLPGRKLTVILDAGHGGTDRGATNEQGLKEKDITLQLVKKIRDLNNDPNIQIILTRESDVMIMPADRAKFVNNQHADLLLSVHLDDELATQVPPSSGMSVYVSRDTFQNSFNSKLFASAVIGRFKDNYKIPVAPNPRQRQVGITILQNALIPAILIESGYIRNENDFSFLTSPTGQKAFAQNVLNAIRDFAAGNYLPELPETPLQDSLPMYHGKRIMSVSVNSKTDKVDLTYVDGSREQISKAEAEKVYHLLPPPPPPPPPPAKPSRINHTAPAVLRVPSPPPPPAGPASRNRELKGPPPPPPPSAPSNAQAPIPARGEIAPGFNAPAPPLPPTPPARNNSKAPIAPVPPVPAVHSYQPAAMVYKNKIEKIKRDSAIDASQRFSSPK